MGSGCGGDPNSVVCVFPNGTKGCCPMSQLECGPGWTSPNPGQKCPQGAFYLCYTFNTNTKLGCNKTPFPNAILTARNLDDNPVMKYSRAARAFFQKYQGPALADFIEESVETAPDFDKYDDGKSS